MTLQELQLSFMRDASQLGNYQELTKTELANGYCDIEEIIAQAKEENDQAKVLECEGLRSAYFSALMLRYWYKIFEWIRNSSSLRLEDIEFVNWLSDCLNDVFYYRSWRYEYKAIVKEGKFIEWKLDENGNKIPNEHYWLLDPNAPDKSINYFTSAKRGKEYQYYNKDKRKSNVIKYSLDQMEDDNGDYAINYAGAYEEAPEENRVEILISELLRRGEMLEALIIDGIANYDTYKEHKTNHTELKIDEETGEEYEEKYTNYSHTFDPRKLVKHLNLINQDFMNNFCETYSVEKVFGNNMFEKLKGLSNTKLYKLIEKTLTELKTDKALMDCIL